MNCLDKATPGEPTVILCRIVLKHVEDLFIYRPSDKNHQILVAHCTIDLHICDPELPGYTANLTSGLLTVTIAAFNPLTDEGEWVCHTTTKETVSTCVKSVFGKLFRVFVIEHNLQVFNKKFKIKTEVNSSSR